MIENTADKVLEPVHTWFYTDLVALQKEGVSHEDIRTRLWAKLEKDENLMTLFKSQYEAEKSHLPFTVEGW
ncbi:hypothetical protein KQI65_14080 [bacterium]|nr:hypothetical protein [bacterium]